MKDISVTETIMKNLYDNRNQNLCCDLCLIPNDNDNPIFVHKIVLLSSNSSYFRELVKHNLETTPLYVPISFNQAEIIVKYLYTGEISFIESTEIKTLFENGKNLKMPFLEEYATDKLIDSTEVSFCLERMRLANKYEIEPLKEKCLNVIASETEKFLNENMKHLTLVEIESIMKIRGKLNIEEIILYGYIKNWILDNYNFRKLYIDEILLKYIDFGVIPLYNIHDELENELDINKKNFNEKILLAISKEKKHNKLKTIARINYSASGEKGLYHIPHKCIEISKINIVKEYSKVVYKNEKYSQRVDYATSSFKYDNREYLLFSGGIHYDTAKHRITADALKSNLIWSPENTNDDGTLKKIPSMLHNRFRHQTIFSDSKIYVCCGYNTTNHNLPTRRCEIFHLGSEIWYDIPELEYNKEYFGLTSVENCLYVIGGDENKSYVERFDPRRDKWEVISGPYTEICNKAFQCSGSSILCISKNRRTFIYDIKNNRFRKDVDYDCMENFSLRNIFQFNHAIYGAYKKDKNQGLYIRKIEKNYENDWKFLNNVEQDYSQLFTISN